MFFLATSREPTENSLLSLCLPVAAPFRQEQNLVSQPRYSECSLQQPLENLRTKFYFCSVRQSLRPTDRNKTWSRSPVILNALYSSHAKSYGRTSTFAVSASRYVLPRRTH